ncbi:MAG: glycoside hydrolase family 25 protein [Atopobiaceae bacterium]|nr:glycoside hydrolase family 25 protein [Atopobiaceae bacterium]
MLATSNKVIHLRRTIVSLFVLAVCLGFTACSGDDDVWIPPRGVPTPYYDQSYFSWEEGRCRYQVPQGSSGKTGVDVSEYQGSIDWYAVASDGIDFAFLRIGYRGTTEGNLFADQHFEENYASAQEAGIACGAYFFSQATNAAEAEEEASFVLELLGGRALDYPVVYDLEVASGTRVSGIDDDAATACAQAFCSTIQAAGYDVMVYGNYYDLMRYNDDVLSAYDLWLAEYADHPSYDRRFLIWQYSNEGTVAGIGSGVDLNLDLGM